MPTGQVAAPEVVRREIVATALRQSGAAAAVLFEAEEGGQCYRPALFDGTSPVADVQFSSSSLLTKWLRTNGEPLEVPDSIGVFEELTTDEQEGLRRLGATACLPLLHDRTLVGVVALVGGSGSIAPTSLRESARQVQASAATLSEAKAEWHARRRAETVARSNRLSVTGQLAASIAHEVRNPLAAIRSTVQLLHSGDVPAEDRQSFLRNVLDEVDRVSLVVTQMLTAGRHRNPTFETCDLVAVVDEAIHFLLGFSRRLGQVIERSGAGSLPVHGDRYELRQVFVNLLLNSCQASAPGARVDVVCELERGQPGLAVVRVVDTGCGIPPDSTSQVFEPFYTTKTDGGGLGLGICREIIGRHGGTIELASEADRGTTITIRLPIEIDHAAHSRR